MSLFNCDMSWIEAQTVLFSAVEGKTKQEIDEIKNEYRKVLPVITEKELEGGPAMTSYEY